MARRIAVIDDDGVIRDLLAEALADEGYEPLPTDLHIPLHAFQGTDAHGDVHLSLCTGESRNDRDGNFQGD